MSAIDLPIQDNDETVPKFRNYVPKDPQLREYQIPAAEVAALDDINQKLKDLREEQITFNLMDDNDAEASILSLAPRENNWDLKRDVEKKLAKLEHITQRSIIELIQAKFSDSDDKSNNISGAIEKLTTDAMEM